MESSRDQPADMLLVLLPLTNCLSVSTCSVSHQHYQSSVNPAVNLFLIAKLAFQGRRKVSFLSFRGKPVNPESRQVGENVTAGTYGLL